MGKRSGFERAAKDLYETPHKAVEPLLPHLAPRTRFIEPCAGPRKLISTLGAYLHDCVSYSDAHQYYDDDVILDATTTTYNVDNSIFITNPPWTREILHKIIVNLSNQAPTWLLFDADWLFTKQATPFLPRLRKVVAIGRVKWIEGSKNTGKDNCCWYLFDKPNEGNSIEFYGKQ